MSKTKKELLSEYSILDKRLNKQMWKIAKKIPNDLESALTTMERMIQNLHKRIEENEKH